jgi:hypothetical protein
MDLSRHPRSPARYSGLGLVVALHLAGLYALSAGLVQPAAKPREVSVLLPPPPPDPLEPERPREPLVKAAQPSFPAVPLPEVPVLALPDLERPGITTEAPRGPVVEAAGAAPGPAAVAPAVPSEPAVRTAGAVCAVMPRPEVPAVAWSGEAVLQVLATVRGGRVVGSEVRIAQGAPDGKTRRALQRSVESALAGYQCQGDAVFQQDFAFRLD